MRRSVILFLVLLLSACAQGPSRAAYLNGLIGLSEADVVRQMGVPSRTFDTEGHKFLAYVEQRQDYVGGGPFFYGGGFFGGGFGYGATFPAQVIDRVCETTVDFVGGRMRGWSLRGNACG